MSTALIFLGLALGLAGFGSVLVWVVHHFPRPREPGYREQLEAIAPVSGQPTRATSGIAALIPLAPARSTDGADGSILERDPSRRADPSG